MLYVTGVEVEAFPGHPESFARLRLPPHTYALFCRPGHVADIQVSWQGIWQRGLRDAGPEAADAACFERYDERFDPVSGNGGAELWIPIRR